MLTTLQDRPWNDPGPRRGQPAEVRTHLPILRAVILDFSAVNNVDVSAVQNLVDVRNQLDRYASPATVGWHFANITSRWTRRALASAGFGYPKNNSSELNWKSIFSVADFDDSISSGNSNAQEKPKYDVEHQSKDDEVTRDSPHRAAPAYDEKKGGNITVTGKSVPLYGVNRPFFHVDVFAAVEAALAVVEQDEAQQL